MPGRITALINQAEKVRDEIIEIITSMHQLRANMPTGRYSDRTKREIDIHESAWLYECENAQNDLEKLCEMMRKNKANPRIDAKSLVLVFVIIGMLSELVIV